MTDNVWKTFRADYQIVNGKIVIWDNSRNKSSKNGFLPWGVHRVEILLSRGDYL